MAGTHRPCNAVQITIPNVDMPIDRVGTHGLCVLKSGWLQRAIIDYTIASLILLTIYLTCSSVTHGPAGRQIPTRNSDSLTPLV